MSYQGNRYKRSSILSVREQGFFDRSRPIRLLILFIFAVCLFTFLHFREVTVENLELGTYSKHRVISQTDFDFADEEATIILRQKMIRDIDGIFYFEPDELLSVRGEWEGYLEREPGTPAFEEGMRALDLWESVLQSARFTNASALQKVNEIGLPAQNYYVYVPKNGSKQTLPDALWLQLGMSAFANHSVSRETINRMISYYASVKWSFLRDVSAEESLKRALQQEVSQQYTRVSEGDPIIDQGERVTSRHLAMMHGMKETLNRNRNLWNFFSLSGSVLLTIVFIAIARIYFAYYHPDILYSNRCLSLLVTILILTLALAKLTEAFLILNGGRWVENIGYPVFIPFAAVLLCCLMNERIALFAGGFLALIMSMTLVVDRIGFLVVNLTAMSVVIIATRNLSKRKEIFWVMGKAWVASFFIIFAFYLYDHTGWSFSLVADLISSFLFLLITAILVTGLLPLLESTFHVLTDIILMEYMDPSNELLQRLAVEAPGTYQHSIVVGYLAEAAAREIGANGLFCRVSTLYHDIGKLVHPQYFTENQQKGIDMHQLLTPAESAGVIIAHVGDGVSMARKAGLPEPFIDIIKEHHGTTLVYFFYHKQCELMKGDKKKVDVSQFRYSGPKPRSKESAIIMIADTLEAASRCLDELEEDTITKLVDEIIYQKSRDRQFEESDLTFEELGKVRKAMIKTLSAAVHSRVKYPRREVVAESG